MESRKQPLHVVGAILLKGDRILVARRAPHKSAPGLWEFPGGKVEFGESPPEALEREILEEMGLRVKSLSTLDTSETLVGNQVIRLEVIVCELLNAFEGFSSDHDEFLWASKDDLLALNWAAPDLPAVELLLGFENLSALVR
jgi:8-oxo-dGTP diphosphatase